MQSVELSEILIAQLSESGYDGFEESEHMLSAFIKEADFNEASLRTILSPFSLSFSSLLIAAKNWNEVWESEFNPVVIDDFVAVRASFHPPFPTVQHDLIITPKMSFGTAHHPTTWLMIDAMRRLEITGKRVLDFGTGTGILAILASRLGAKDIIAIDIDDWSIENATENIAVNNCDNIKVIQAEAPGAHGRFDVILANINLSIITENLIVLSTSCNPGATILLSGFLTRDKEIVISNSTAHGFTPGSIYEKDGWLCICITAFI